MMPGARSKFVAPMFEPEDFRKQMYCSEVLVTLLGLFGALIVSAGLRLIWPWGIFWWVAWKCGYFRLKRKKKLDLATENILHNISDQPIFL